MSLRANPGIPMRWTLKSNIESHNTHTTWRDAFSNLEMSYLLVDAAVSVDPREAFEIPIPQESSRRDLG